MMIAARNAFLISGAKLPYDAEIEYLESTGTQWIDTGVHGTETTKIEAGINPSQDSGITAKFFGDYSGATASRRLYGGILIGENNRTIVCKYGAITKPVFGTDGNYVPKDVISLFRMGPTGVSCGETFSASWTASNVFSTAATLYLFKYNGHADASAFIGKMYFCQIYINSSLVRDFIPVRVGQVGYLYDRVSGELFGNAGTGAFVIGLDK